MSRPFFRVFDPALFAVALSAFACHSSSSPSAAPSPAPEHDGDTETVVGEGILAPSYHLVTNAATAIPEYQRALDRAASRFQQVFGEAPARIVLVVIDTVGRGRVRLAFPNIGAQEGVVVFASRVTSRPWPFLRRRVDAAEQLVAEHAANLWLRDYVTKRSDAEEEELPDWLFATLAGQLSDPATGARAISAVRERRDTLPSIAAILRDIDAAPRDTIAVALERAIFAAFLLEQAGPSGLIVLVEHYARSKARADGDESWNRDRVDAVDLALDQSWRSWSRELGLD